MITIGLPSAIQHQMATRLTVVVGYMFLSRGLPRSVLHMVAVKCMLMKLNEEERERTKILVEIGNPNLLIRVYTLSQ